MAPNHSSSLRHQSKYYTKVCRHSDSTTCCMADYCPLFWAERRLFNYYNSKPMGISITAQFSAVIHLRAYKNSNAPCNTRASDDNYL